MRAIIFYGPIISFFFGVFFSSFWTIDKSVFLWLSALSFALFVIFLRAKRRNFCLVFVFACAFGLGAYRMEISKGGSHELDQSVGKNMELSGFVCDDPAKKESSVKICFKPDNAEDRILVTLQKNSPYFYGHRLKIKGRLDLPENFVSYDGGPEFDYVSYLQKDEIRYLMYMPKATLEEGRGGSVAMAWLFKFKSFLTDKIRLILVEPQASLLGGLLLGDKQSMPKETAEDFKAAGLVHILVLSGYNVTIIAESLMKFFSCLPNVVGRSLGAFSIVAFALMTGASATTVRASVMALVVIGLRSCGRKYDVTRALLFAGFLMVLENPMILCFDVSFELSFMATLGLIFVSPLFSEKLGFITEKFNLREMVSTTISTQIFVLPFLLYTMGQTSVIGLISNIFVLPAVPYSMFLGFIAIVISFISVHMALPLAWILNLLLLYIIKAVSFFADFPYAIWKTSIGETMLAFAYVSYTLILVFLWRRRGNSPL